jgi:hypothetical protein
LAPFVHSCSEIDLEHSHFDTFTLEAIMPILTQPAFGPKLSIGFITGGALIDVWALVWRTTIAPAHLTESANFWFWGFLLTGATFVVIGAFLGSIGRAARKSELPPTEATPAEASIQATAAANPSHVVTNTPAAPLGVNAPSVTNAAEVVPVARTIQPMPPARPAMG